MDCRTPGVPINHQLPELAQTHIHRVSDVIQQSHPLSSPSPAFNLSQHQGLFQWVSSLHQVAKVLEFQLQPQSFQWIFRTDSKLEKDYDKAVYCHTAYLIYMQSISCKMPCWMNHKLESRWLEEITITSDMQITHPNGTMQKWTKEPFDEGERGK